MPAPSAVAPPQSRTPAGANTQRQVVPFIRSTKKHREPFFDFTTGTGASTLSPINIPAYGFLRGLWIRVDGVGGAGVAATYAADAPWTVFSFLGLFDVNGAPLVGPFATGYNLFLISKYGAYHRYFDSRNADFTTPTTGNLRFWLYLPVEMIRRNGMGSLANLNAAATYKLQLSVNSTLTGGGVFTLQPSTPLTGWRIRIWLDAWTQPPQQDLLGNMTAQLPINHGTTQFWSEQVYTISSGQQTVRLLRVGLYLRMLIFTLRTSGGVRGPDTDWADPVQLFLDGFELVNLSQNFLWTELYSLYNTSPNTPETANNRDTGVYVFQFVDDDSSVLGNEERNRYLPTLQSSRLELRGSFGATASQLSCMTCDIAPAGSIFVDATQNASI
jgi:hypothetical protein